MNPTGIHIDLTKLCSVTGFSNNCGLNCLVHFLSSKIESGELQRNMGRDPNYTKILEQFQGYYQLSATPSWDDIANLLATFPVPTDREAILGPVLRYYLAEVLIENKADFFDPLFFAALDEYITTGNLADNYLPVYHSNKRMFESIKNLYDGTPDNEKQTMLEKLRDDLNSYWLEEGALHYAEYMSTSQTMVSAEQLILLGKSLNIRLEIYTPFSIKAATDNPTVCANTHGAQDVPEGNFMWTLRVHNRGEHWEFEHPTRDHAMVNNHNDFYPEVFHNQAEEDAFFAYDDLSGKFKIGMGHNPTGVGIIESIQSYFSPISQARIDAESDMNCLLDSLNELVDRHEMTEDERQLVFESYFDRYTAQLILDETPVVKDVLNQYRREIENFGLPSRKHDLSDDDNERPTKFGRK